LHEIEHTNPLVPVIGIAHREPGPPVQSTSATQKREQTPVGITARLFVHANPARQLAGSDVGHD
jgi:hypothetical protein